jgi:hypothetical protein
MKAKIKVRDGETLIKEYEIEYASNKELHRLYHEAREVWAEYHVEADLPTHIISYSHTYKEQFHNPKTNSQ